MSTKSQQNYINHIALVLDASGSMSRHREQLIKVADDQIAYLARRSKELDQETRVTVYSFDDTVKCLVYDKDVLRLPSIRSLYQIGGMTALIDATLKSQDDLAHTWEGYGDHSFLTFILTDGEENASNGGRGIASHYLAPLERKKLITTLSDRLESLPDHWTVAVLVPDQLGKRDAMAFGFPKDNIAIWDATSQQGVEEAVSVIRTATDTYMTNRTMGVRGSRSLFVGGQVDADAVKAKLIPLAHNAYDLVPVTAREGDASFEKRKKPTKKFPEGEVIGRFIRIDDFIRRINNGNFALGMGYYQLFSHGARTREKVQGNKEIAILDKKTSQIYVGPEARKIVGLPEGDATVDPGANPDYEIFVRSTSENRHLPVGTKLLIMK